MKETIYSKAIKTKNIQEVFKVFRSQLDKFLQDEGEIYSDWLCTDEKNYKRNTHLRCLFSEKWYDFIECFPGSLSLKCKDENGKDFRMSDLTGGDVADGTDSELNRQLIEQLVRYTVYIHKQESMLFKELVIWQSLTLVAKMINIYSMAIQPSFVISVVKQIIREVDDGTFKKPQASYWNGTMYDFRLSSSEKASLFRRKVIEEWTEEYFTSYLNKYKRLPSKQEAINYLRARCVESKDNRLDIFSDGMNMKTFKKYCGKFQWSKKRSKRSIRQ